MYHVSAQGVDECMINVHYYYYEATKLNIQRARLHFTTIISSKRRALISVPVIIIHKFSVALFPAELRVLRTRLKNECVTNAIVLCHMMKAAGAREGP